MRKAPRICFIPQGSPEAMSTGIATSSLGREHGIQYKGWLEVSMQKCAWQQVIPAAEEAALATLLSHDFP